MNNMKYVWIFITFFDNYFWSYIADISSIYNFDRAIAAILAFSMAVSQHMLVHIPPAIFKSHDFRLSWNQTPSFFTTMRLPWVAVVTTHTNINFFTKEFAAEGIWFLDKKLTWTLQSFSGWMQIDSWETQEDHTLLQEKREKDDNHFFTFCCLRYLFRLCGLHGIWQSFPDYTVYVSG